MSLCGQVVAGGLGEAAFHLDLAASEFVFHEARGFQCGLDVHFEVDDVGHELGVGLGLVPAAHDAEGRCECRPLRMKAGMMVCSGRLRPARALGASGSRLNRPPRLWSAKPVPGGDDAGAEAGIVALDQRDHVAVAIDDGEVGGVAAAGGRAARRSGSHVGADRGRSSLARSVAHIFRKQRGGGSF